MRPLHISVYKLVVVVHMLLLPLMATAQHGVTVRFTPKYNGETIDVNAPKYLPYGKDSLTVETFRCYVSNIHFLKSGRVVYSEKNSYQLLDAAEGKMQIALNNTPEEYDAISFDLGIDSVTNVSGVMGGDLDPVNGMYWAWQSGYINFKLEGKSNVCATRNHEYSFHIGGYAGRDKAVQHVVLKIHQSNIIDISVNIDQFLGGIDLSKQNSVMIPGPEAVSLAERLAGIFQIVQQ